MTLRKLSVFLAAMALSTGVGVAVAMADDQPTPGAGCVVQAGQRGVDEQQATENAADSISTAAAEVEQAADSPEADDQAGDQHGATDVEEQGEANQCGQQEGDQGGDGHDGAQGDQEGNG